MRTIRERLSGMPSFFVAGICAASAAISIGGGNISGGALLVAAALLVIAPSLPVDRRIVGAATTKS